MLQQIHNRLRSAFGYDILVPGDKRKAIRNVSAREDAFARGSQHRQLSSSAAELQRNLSLVGWMVRRHLDYVAMFKFRSRTGNKQLDNLIQQLMEEDSRRSRTDVAGKFGREKMFRLAEARRVLDGDTFLLKLADGRMQGIQADLVRDPPDTRLAEGEEWINGVLVNGVGRPLSYGFWKRRGYQDADFLRRVNSMNVIHYGFFDRYATDQVRGISPIVSSLAPLQDVYENFDYALAKAKVSQLFAVAFYREGTGQMGELTSTYGRSADIDGDELEEPTEYKVSFSDGPQVFDLDPGDRAEFLEGKSPSSELQAFTLLVIQVALKALDIPYSFYDEKHTNFFGSRAAWMHYDRSAKDKRDDQIEMRRQYTVWKYRQWMLEGRMPVGPIDALPFEWVPIGMPWWDPSKEIRGNVEAIQAGLDTPQRICRSTGTDFYENVDDIAEAVKYAEQKGVSLAFATVSSPQAMEDEPVVTEDEENEEETDDEREDEDDDQSDENE